MCSCSRCPNEKCKEFVPIDIMRQVLTSDEFERWEKLLLQQTLDSMSDIIYCPKCNSPIVVDENDTHSYCLECNIDFCKLCREIWHSVSYKFNFF
jgi:E3 ubiquitin-protein ligase RNF14